MFTTRNKRKDNMGTLKAEQARQLRSIAIEQKKKEDLAAAQDIPFFAELTEKVNDAALDGQNSIQIGPYEAEHYQEIIDSGHTVPGIDKELPQDWKKVLKVFEQSLGYKVTISKYPAQFMRNNGLDLITLEIETANVYW